MKTGQFSQIQNKILRCKKGLLWFFISMLASSALFANPVVDHVASGNVSIQQTPSSTTINQTSSKAIINWQSFNINKGESTHFQQPAGGVALNRISATQGASQIYGSLTATGQIILVNPAGIYFGPSAYVNVGGLIATTANITDQNFLNGNYVFTKVPGYNGTIINTGQIIAANHGLIALVGSNVTNEGMIQAGLGRVVLASGEAFTMNFSGDDLINFKIDAPAAKGNVTNTGSIYADGGKVLVTAGMAANVLDNTINLKGLVQARSIYEEEGEIIISGDPNAGVVSVAAKMKSGKIGITGYNILLDSSAYLDASGDFGGGEVKIGALGTNAVVMATGATINADATTLGNGGNVILWSDNVTRAYGSISARGGEFGGNGGFVETSSHGYLDVGDVRVDTSAPNGNRGLWLLDPYDVLIGSAANSNGSYNGGNPNIWTPSGSVSVVNNTTLESNLALSDVTITTTGAGLDPGNITVSAPITWTSVYTLYLQATNNIIINAAISAVNGTLQLSAVNAVNSITTGAGGTIAVKNFILLQGRWIQVSNPLPAFSVTNNFQLSSNAVTNSTVQFLRALSGDGSSGTPYMLTDIYGVQGIGSSTTLMGNYFNLSNSIDASSTVTWNSGAGFKTLGQGASYSYSGTLNGLGNTIDKLYINTPSISYTAFISSLGGTVTNLGLTNVNIYSSNSNSTAGMVASNGGTMTTVYVTGLVQGLNANAIGGVVASGGGTISGSYNAATVIATGTSGYVGGLQGITTGTITTSYNTGAVSSASGVIGTGGVVGYINAGAPGVSNSFNLGNVSGGTLTGGVAGFAGGPISGSSNIGNIIGSSEVGGVAGGSNANISTSYNAGSIYSAGNFAGGVLGANGNTITISDSYNAGSVYGAGTKVGGLAGSVDAGTGSTILRTYSAGAVTGGSEVGGLLGSCFGCTVTNSYWDTQTSGQATSAGGTGLTTSQMMNTANFTGWSITSTIGTSTIAPAATWFLFSGQTRPMLVAEFSNLVYTPHQLQLAGSTLGAGFSLARNIDLYPAMHNSGDVWATNGSTGAGWVPIGNVTNAYTGVFNGQNYTVNGLYINSTSGASYLGLFGRVGTTLSNAGVTNVYINATGGGQYIGGLIGYLNVTTLFNSYSTGLINTSGSSYVGGLVGRSDGNIIDSHNATTVVADSTSSLVGGVVGANVGGTVSNSYNIGAVTGGTSNTGGVVGQNSGNVSSSYNAGTITSSNTGGVFIGGVIGLHNSGTLSGSYNTGYVYASGSSIGGLVGQSASGTINTSYNLGPVTGLNLSNNVAGLVGTAQANISTSFNAGTVTNGGNVTGGLIGLTSGTLTITNNYNVGTVYGTTNVGGLVGSVSSGASTTLTDSYNSGWISGTDSANVGALVGSGSPTNSDLYYDTKTSGASSTIGNSRTTAQMMQSANLSGLDITATASNTSTPPSNVWFIFNGLTRPMLLSQWSTSVSNVYQLQLMAAALGANYTLTKNIDATNTGTNLNDVWATTSYTGAGFVPVGTNTAQYSGLFNGAGYTINNLYIKSTAVGVGLFGGLSGTLNSAAVYGNITGTLGSTQYIGGVVGYSNAGTIQTSYNAANIVGTSSSYIGGIVGYNNGGVATNVYNIGTVVGGTSSLIGGIVGNNTGVISYSYNSGYISSVGTPTGVGGLSGSHSGTLTANFFDTTTSNRGSSQGCGTQSNCSGVTGAATSNLMTLSTYSDAGWNVTATPSNTSIAPSYVWFIFPGQTRPMLYIERTTTITNSHQLQMMGSTLGGNYILGNDINLYDDLHSGANVWGTNGTNSGVGFAPIGSSVQNPFSGIFDGRGYTISNLYMYLPTTSNVGLFGVNSGKVQNITLSSVNINGFSNVGSLIGYNLGSNAKVYYVNTSGSVYGNNQYTGGLVGLNVGGSITNSYNSANVTVGSGASYAGGFVGANSNGGYIHNSYNIGAITATGASNIGGMVGNNTGASLINNTYSTGAVTTTGSSTVGGFVGLNDAVAFITNSFWDTATSGQSSGSGSNTATVINLTGGCFLGVSCANGGTANLSALSTYANVGWNISSTPSANTLANRTWFIFAAGTRPLLMSEWRTVISTPHQLQMMGASLAGSYTLKNSVDMSSAMSNAADVWGTNGNVTGAGFVPVGNQTTYYTGIFNGANYVVDNLYISQPTVSFPVGYYLALFGKINTGALLQFIGVTNVNIIGNNTMGGLAGQVDGGTILDSYSSGSITGVGSNPQNIGGLVGFNFAGTITRSSSTVDIYSPTNLTYVGGFAGRNRGTISSSFSAGNITTPSSGLYIGGFVGYNDGSGINVSTSYSGTSINLGGTGSTGVGGFVGTNENGTITNTYSFGALTINGGSATGIGGFAGRNAQYFASSGTISNSYTTSPLSLSVSGGTIQVGGFVGENISSNISNSFWDTATTGISTGFYANTGSISNLTGGCFSGTNCANGGTANLAVNSTFSGVGWSITNVGGTSYAPTTTWFIVDGGLRPMLIAERTLTITNAHQLQMMAVTNGGNYKLGNNIDMYNAMHNQADVWGTNVGPASNILLPANYTANASTYVSTGAGYINYTTFKGIFDGQGYTISNQYVNGNPNGVLSGYDYRGGLFPYAASEFGNTAPIIKNVGLINAYVSGVGYVGGLIGVAAGAIVDNVFVSGGSVNGINVGTSWNNYVGGIIGYDSSGASTFTNSYSSATINAFGHNVSAGGFIGYGVASIISNSYATGTVNAIGDGLISVTTNAAGGFAGTLTTSGSISNSYSTGAVNGNNLNAGGFIGNNLSSSTVSNSFWDTATSGKSIGYGLNSATITNLTGGCFTGTSCTYGGTANLSSANTYNAVNWNIGTLPINNTWLIIGGSTRPMLAGEYTTKIATAHSLQLIGINTNTLSGSYTIINNIDASGVSTSSDSWGTAKFIPIGTSTNPFNGVLDGKNYAINNLTVTAASSTNVGLVGYNTGTLKNLIINNATVTGNTNVGILAGASSYGTISNVFVSGTVTGTVAGGLVGLNQNTPISTSYSGATVTGSSGGSSIGGFVGSNNGSFSAISNSYSTGAVTGGSSSNGVGGFVGLNTNSASITNSYSSGLVTGGSGSTNVGGLVGLNNNSATASNSFWDTQTSGQASSAVGTGITTSQMKTASTFSSPGWSIDSTPLTLGSSRNLFTTTWFIFQTGGSTRPMLTAEWNKIINTPHQLQLVGANVDGIYTLASDLALSSSMNNSGDVWGSGSGIVPIGTSSLPFVGKFNGRNYSISNLYINLPGTFDVGLFGYTSNSQIFNVKLTSATVTGNQRVGILAGTSDNVSYIFNGYSSGTVSGNTHIGGLVGSNEDGSYLIYSSSAAAVSGNLG